MASGKSIMTIHQLKPIFINPRFKCLCVCNYWISKAYSVWEPDRQGGYGGEQPEPSMQLVKDGVKTYKQEFIKFAKEQKAHIGMPLHKIVHDVQHSDYEVIYKFNEPEVIKQWTVITDKAFRQGKSEAEFVLGPQKNGIFRGIVNTETIKDGVVKYAGYAGIRSPFAMKSFFRYAPLDWSRYTHLLVRCRGDGRPYQLSIGIHRTFDIQWHDQYNFPLYTRGGPYWQLAKIPFRKFYLSSKGRVQDKQEMPDIDRVLYVTITQADGYSGPFQLEIDFIGVLYDATHIKIHEYELYEVDPYELY